MFRSFMTSASSPLKTILIESLKKPATAALIFLHGLGDTGHGWSPISQELAPALPHVRFIFPTAPTQPVSINFGMKMPSWFDIYSLSDYEKQDEPGLLESSYKVTQIVNELVNEGIPANRIILGGFSQGCALALYTALTTEYQLAGCIGLSGFLPLHDKVFQRASDNSRKMPILLGHGDADSVVGYQFGQLTANILSRKGYNVEFKTYPGLDHGSNAKELSDILAFLIKHLPLE